jgi:hypothetical protein
MNIRTIDFDASVILDAAVEKAVQGAYAAGFAPEPLFSADISRVVSVLSSVVKRHGPLIEEAIFLKLQESGRYILLRNQPVPTTKAGIAVARNQDLVQLEYCDDDRADTVDVDLCAIDTHKGIVRAVQIKRGGGRTDSRKRRQIEGGLRAAALTLSSYMRTLGYTSVTQAEVAVVDFYGASGFSPSIVVGNAELDRFFEVPLVDTIEMMTAQMRHSVRSIIPELLRPMLDNRRVVFDDEGDQEMDLGSITAEAAVSFDGRRSAISTSPLLDGPHA